MLHALVHALEHAFFDSLKLLPYLFLTYLLLELLEHKAGDGFHRAIKKAGAFGPLAGAVLGLVPQCGFAIAAVEFMRGGVISFGTLLAIMISTSDEALPVLLAGGAGAKELLLILGGKAAIAAAAGFAADLLLKRNPLPRGRHSELHHHCHHHSCEQAPLKASLIHTAKSYMLVFVSMMVLHLLVDMVGRDTLMTVLSGKGVLVNLGAMVFGFLPGCAPSIMLSQLYLEGALSLGGLMGGLVTNTGLGMLTLLRSPGHKKKKIILVLVLLGIGAAFSVLFA